MHLTRANDHVAADRVANGPPFQVTLLKQEKVPCLSDNEARLSADPKDPFRLLTKPHGHGDVHFLLHSTGTLDRWQQVQFLVFCSSFRPVITMAMPSDPCRTDQPFVFAP